MREKIKELQDQLTIMQVIVSNLIKESENLSEILATTEQIENLEWRKPRADNGGIGICSHEGYVVTLHKVPYENKYSITYKTSKGESGKVELENQKTIRKAKEVASKWLNHMTKKVTSDKNC